VSLKYRWASSANKNTGFISFFSNRLTNFDSIISTLIFRTNGDASDSEIIIIFPSG